MPDEQRPIQQTPDPAGRDLRYAPIVVILLVAAFLRLVRLDRAPSGLLVDEAYNGLDVLRILAGARPIFLPANYGREALFMYLQSVSVAALGPTDFALRLVAAFAGILTIPISYVLVRRLFDRRVALLTCAWLAVSLWHVIFSRIGLRAILLPLVLAASFYFLWRGLAEIKPGEEPHPQPLSTAVERHPEGTRGRSRRGEVKDAPRTPSGLRWFGLSGLALGLSQYTYTSARFAPFVVAAFALYVLLAHRDRFVQILPGLAVVGIVALVVFAPEGWYFATHPADFLGRADAVSIFNASLNQGSVATTFARSAAQTLGMFVWRGDRAWDRNISGWPVFDPISSALFALGAIWVALRWREPRSAFLIVWIAAMLLPSALTAKDVPNYLRATGTIPAVDCLPALGASLLWSIWERRFSTALKRLPGFIAGVAFGLGALLTGRAYFGQWAAAPEVIQLFDTDRWAAISATTRLTPTPGTSLYVGAGDRSGPMQTFALSGLASSEPLRVYDGKHTLVFAPSGQPTTYLFSPVDRPPSDLIARLANGARGEVIATTPAGASVTRFDVGAAIDYPTPTHPLAARLGDAFEITGFDLPSEVHAGQTATVRWYWRLLRTDNRDLTFFNQLLDDSGAKVAQLDDRPITPSYWPAGTTGVSWFDLPVDPNAQSGPLTLVVGIYDPATMARLPIVDPQGHAAGDHLTLGPIKVHGRPAPMPTFAIPRVAHFADQIDLLGYAQSPTQPTAGQQTTLTLVWRARGRPSRDYTVFVHLLDANNQLVTQADAPPRSGGYPTSLWDSGETIADEHHLTLPATLPSGTYHYAIGWYAPDTGERLGASDGAGQSLSDTVVLDGPVLTDR